MNVHTIFNDQVPSLFIGVLDPMTNPRAKSYYYSPEIHTSIIEPRNNISHDFILYQNYPNPFNSRTVIPFELPMAQNIEIDIFDPSGKEIFTLFKGRISEGYHELTVDGNNLASGVYYYQIKSHNYTKTNKFVLLK